MTRDSQDKKTYYFQLVFSLLTFRPLALLFRLWQRRGAVFLVLVLCSLFSIAYSTEGAHQQVRLDWFFFFLCVFLAMLIINTIAPSPACLKVNDKSLFVPLKTSLEESLCWQIRTSALLSSNPWSRSQLAESLVCKFLCAAVCCSSVKAWPGFHIELTLSLTTLICIYELIFNPLQVI